MIINGKKIAEDIQNEVKQTISTMCDRPPCLIVLLVGEHPPSMIYVQRKAQACEQVGIRSIIRKISPEITEEDLIKEVEKLNHDDSIDGILVQLPLPSHINPLHITHAINPEKDVDGFHPTNVGKLLNGENDGFISCTPLGIKTMIERSGIEIAGKHALVIGRSNIVGKPMAALLIQQGPGGNATVTIANRHTQNLKTLSLLADLIIVAIGQPLFLTGEMVKKGAVVIDVGINKIEDKTKETGYRIVGDVDFTTVAPKCSFITPVPGGVGPMTIAMLLQNTLTSYLRRLHRP